MPPNPITPPDSPPALRLPTWSLPAYRFVPGLHPHPFRHPDGHAYTDGSPPAEETWAPRAPWQQDRGWLRGLDLFDHRYWWEAHEAWEAVWHQVPRGTPYSELLQGMIQGGAALLKAHLGQGRAADRLLDKAETRLARVAAAGPAEARGLDLEAAVTAWRTFRTEGTWPPPLGA